MKRLNNSNKGFTTIELLTVVAIVGILGVMASVAGAVVYFVMKLI
jgi:prepilin-type N-terminal cleavage/methylation domain-containing protein